jgi:hypothetical protein
VVTAERVEGKQLVKATATGRESGEACWSVGVKDELAPVCAEDYSEGYRCEGWTSFCSQGATRTWRPRATAGPDCAQGPQIGEVLDLLALVDYLTLLLDDSVSEVTVAAAVIRKAFAPMVSG